MRRLNQSNQSDRTPLSTTPASGLVMDVPTLCLQYQTPEQAVMTLEALLTNKFVRILTLMGPHADGEPRRWEGGADRVAEAAAMLLQSNTSIQSLGLIGWGVTCHGAASLAESIERLPGGGGLIKLDLAQNRIASDGARKLRNSLRRNYSLLEVTLDGNPVVTSQSSRSAGRQHIRAIHSRLAFNRARSGQARRKLGVLRSEAAAIIVRRFGLCNETLGAVMKLAYPVGRLENEGDHWVWRDHFEGLEDAGVPTTESFNQWSRPVEDSQVQGADMGYLESWCRTIYERRNGFALEL